MEVMTEQELAAIEDGAGLKEEWHKGHDLAGTTHHEMRALVAEVRRLNDVIKQAEWSGGGDVWCGCVCPWCQGLIPHHGDDCPAFQPANGQTAAGGALSR